MDHPSDSTMRKNSKRTRRRLPMNVPLPSIFLFLFLISQLVTTTTIVVIATEIQAEESGVVNDIGESESETLPEQPERQALHSPEETEIDTNTINNTKEDANSVESEDDSAISEDTSNESPDSSLPSSDETETGNSSEESTTDDAIENEIEETTTESLDDNEIVETENSTLLSSGGETADEMPETDVTEMDEATAPETDQDEDEMPSTPTAESTSSESVLEDDIENSEPMLEAASSSSAETATEPDVESTEPEQDVEVGIEEKTDDEEVPEDETLDDPSEEMEASDSQEETETEEGDESDSNENEDNQVDIEVNDKARARARAREDRLKPKPTNATTTTPEEVETTENSTAGYRGEPWGQYRSFRRLPDLELLRLVFENSNKTRAKSNGDAESNKVVNDWQKDPLYDEKLAKDSGSGEPYLGDEQDPKFREYRANLLDKTDEAVGDNETTKASNGNENEPVDEQDTNDVDANNNNSEFGDGLDDIDKFFEGVNPPDELDVGYGSSIQDVLIDKGKDILLKKIRGFGHWIKIGWQTMGRKLKERISEFQLPFQKIDDTSSAASESETKSLGTKEQREELVENTKDALTTAWKVGKQTVEVISDFVDGVLDRFDDKGEDESANFEDFGGFDLDDLSSFKPPV